MAKENEKLSDCCGARVIFSGIYDSTEVECFKCGKPCKIRPETKQCPQCKNSLDLSAFTWDKEGKICNGCFALNEKSEEDWEKEFDDKFGEINIDDGNYELMNLAQEVKDFIRNLLASQKEKLENDWENGYQAGWEKGRVD